MIPPTGSTFPRRVISPVMAVWSRTLRWVKAEAREVIMAIRNMRKEKNIPPREMLVLSIKKNLGERPDLTFDPVVEKLTNLSEINYVDEKVDGAITFIVKYRVG